MPKFKTQSRNVRKRVFTGHIYHEHFATRDDLVSFFMQYRTPFAVSPLHDKDTFEVDSEEVKSGKAKVGDIKKAHWHYVIKFDNPRSLNEVRQEMNKYGDVLVCFSEIGTCRYFCHLDNPEKAPYFDNSVAYFGYPYEQNIHASRGNQDKLELALALIINNDIRSLTGFIRYLYLSDGFRWLLDFVSSKTYFFNQFFSAFEKDDYNELVK